jgi:four helix bundle protein
MNDDEIRDSDRKGSFRDLVVWQKSIDLVEVVYRTTQAFPVDERFGLISQMRRAAVSVPSNIAEGHARHTTGEFIRFVANAEGSIAELETHFVISQRLGFLGADHSAEGLLEEIRKMLNALRRSLSRLRNDAS